MPEAIILFGGKVKRDSNLSNLTFNNKSGFVTSFVLKGKETSDDKKYTHSIRKNYLSDNTVPAIDTGYYEESQFLQYLAKRIRPQDLIALNLSRLEDAAAGDIIKVNKLKISAPYDDFCKINAYSWIFDPTLDVLDNDGNIIFRSSDPVPVDIPLSPTAYSFFNHNIPLIKSNDFPDDKDDSAYSLALIALEIHRINRDIFPLFSQSPELTTYINTQNSEWASGTIFTQPTYEDILQYEESLVNYYNTAYSNQLLIVDSPKNTQLFWLAIVLSASGLAVLPIDLKLSMLKQIPTFLNVNYTEDAPYSPFKDIAAEGPAIILKIVDSITVAPTQSDYFLTQLLTYQLVSTTSNFTLFESLYSNLSDNRIGRRTHGLINSFDNRKQFIRSLYNIWKISKNYPKYDSPSYTQPVNPDTGVYPEANYIVNKGTAYNKVASPATIVYASSSTTLTEYLTTFTYELKGDKIVVSKVVTLNVIGEDPYTTNDTTLYGTYDLYQPVSVLGMDLDKSIKLPTTKCLPVFYLLYLYDCQQQQDADFLIELFVELAINFAIFSPIGELGYLLEISDIARVANSPGDFFVLYLETILGVSRLIQFTAGSFQAITIYIAENSTDPDLRDFCKTLNEFLTLVSLAALGVEIEIQTALLQSGGKVVAEINELGDAITLEDGVIEEITILSDPSVIIDLMNEKLAELPTSHTNITSVFQSLNVNPNEQVAFFNDFYRIKNNDIIWTDLENSYTPTPSTVGSKLPRSLLDDWLEIKILKNERKNFDFVRNYSRFKYLKAEEYIHIRDLYNKKNPPGFDPIGGHLDLYFGTGEMMSITDLSIPIEDRTVANSINGHVVYFNMYFKKPPGATGGLEYPANSGNLYYKKPTHFVLDPNWDEQRIIEEMSYAYTRKHNPRLKKTSPILNQSNQLETTDYQSQFSDGTKVEIIHRNYDRDPVTKDIVYDRVSLIKIVLKYSY